MKLHSFFQRHRKLLLIGMACLVLALIAGSVLLRPALTTFAMLPNTVDCHAILPMKVPGRDLIVPSQGCKSFSVRVRSQRYPTQIRVCPQQTVGPITLLIPVDTYQQTFCTSWTATTGEWHDFYRYQQITDMEYQGFLVFFSNPDGRSNYTIQLEVQQ